MADVVEEYIPQIGGTTAAGNLCDRCREDAASRGGGGCSFFKTREEYEAILRDWGLLGPAATPEQGQRRAHPVMFAAVEGLKQKMVAQKLAIAQLKTKIEDFKGFKGKLGAGDKVQKVAKTDLRLRWAKAIVKWFFVANGVVLLFAIVVAMSLK